MDERGISEETARAVLGAPDREYSGSFSCTVAERAFEGERTAVELQLPQPPQRLSAQGSENLSLPGNVPTPFGPFSTLLLPKPFSKRPRRATVRRCCGAGWEGTPAARIDAGALSSFYLGVVSRRRR